MSGGVFKINVLKNMFTSANDLAAIDDKIDDLSESIAKDYALKSNLNDATGRISTLETNTYTKDECNNKFIMISPPTHSQTFNNHYINHIYHSENSFIINSQKQLYGVAIMIWQEPLCV